MKQIQIIHIYNINRTFIKIKYERENEQIGQIIKYLYDKKRMERLNGRIDNKKQQRFER